MFCRKCGAELPESASVCPACEEAVEMPGMPGQEPASNPTYAEPEPAPKRKKTLLIAICAVAAACLVGVCILLGVQSAQKNKLHEELMRGWSRVEEGDSGTYFRLELDFDEDSVDYNFYSGIAWLDTTLATFDYKVISGNKIKLLDYDRVFEIEFNEEHTCFQITPSLTDANSSEFWYHFD